MEFLYFYISYSKTKQENISDIKFVVPEKKEQKPECISSEEIYDKKSYNYKKIFKVNKSAAKGKKATNYYFEFETGEYRYIISFDSKGSTFVYDATVEVEKRRIEIRRKVNQNMFEYTEKLDSFEAALKKKGEENKIDDLYEQTINLYSKKKGFSLLISLFLKIYKKKNLCSSLLKKFKEMNGNPKDNEKNMDRKSNLKDYTSIFKEIKVEAKKLIESNNYDTIDFYGIILCYLNYYDYDNFIKIVEELSTEKPNDLYEILLTYHAHFKYPINLNLDFFNKLIKYTILNKDFTVFQNGLGYIKDLGTFINVIDENKEDFYEKYIKSNNSQKNEKNIIKVDKNLISKKIMELTEKKAVKEVEIKKENNNEDICTKIEEHISNNIKSSEQCKEDNNENNITLDIIKKIKSIIKFSDEKEIFFLYFTNEFWKELLNYNKEPNIDNIYNCSELRKVFIIYYELVMKIFGGKKKITIKNEAISYYERDEFAFRLDQKIREYINNNKDIQNIEKLQSIKLYNPYYNEEKYYIKERKIDADIFNLFDLINIDDDFVSDFRKMNFEKIFKEKIVEYINKITSKIKTIADFELIIKLINIKNISEKNVYLDSLNKKYDMIIKPNIESLVDDQLNEAIKVVAKIALINFMYENEEKKKFNFIEKRIKKLDKEKLIIPKIFIEIIKLCIEKENNKKKENEEEEENENNEKKEIEEEKENENNEKNEIKEEKEKENNDKKEIEEGNNIFLMNF